MRWQKEESQRPVIVSGNGRGAQTSQLSNPVGLVFDRHRVLYLTDLGNARVQRFSSNWVVIVIVYSRLYFLLPYPTSASWLTRCVHFGYSKPCFIWINIEKKWSRIPIDWTFSSNWCESSKKTNAMNFESCWSFPTIIRWTKVSFDSSFIGIETGRNV